MKIAAKVFIIIGLVASVVVLIYGLIFMGIYSGVSQAKGLVAFYLIYGIYSLATSIGSLISIHGSSKGAVIAWGVFYIPVFLLASIFMFCIKEEDLF